MSLFPLFEAESRCLRRLGSLEAAGLGRSRRVFRDLVVEVRRVAGIDL